MRRAGQALLATLLLFLAPPALAHHVIGHAGPASGIAIPSLTHGQMAVIARNRAAIVALAAEQAPTDETFRRLLNFANVERAVCLWGLMPGSVRDEASPFNECAHAYLAATMALLLHVDGMANRTADVPGLVRRIDEEMFASGAALVLCRYSGESFNTAALVYPSWGDALLHPPSLAVFAALLLGLLAAGRLLRQLAAGPPGHAE